MNNLEGKVICNAFMKCNDHDTCNHRIPHEHSMFCRMVCGSGGVPGGTCVPIEVFWIDDKRVYAVKMQDGNYHKLPEDPAPTIPNFYMDEMIFICPSHASCPHDDCTHKEFHNRSQGCGVECYRGMISEVCREANSDEILQLFRDHDGENQHIDDALKKYDQVYSEFMEKLTKPMPEKPKPMHERVKRFLNLEL